MKFCSSEKHRAKCRKDRPLCRWRRASYAVKKVGVKGPCQCTAFHFPHRPGSGDCVARGGLGTPAVLQETEAEYNERKRRSRW